MNISALDHLVLTVSDIAATCRFYSKILGMTETTFADGRKALQFGNQKINLHPAGREFEPKALRPTPGSADLCFITQVPMTQVLGYLVDCGIAIIAGPVRKIGAAGELVSVYIRDPDGNLIEIANPTGQRENTGTR